MAVVYYEILRKTVAVKKLRIGFQVVNFSRCGVDLFFMQFRVAIRRVNIHWAVPEKIQTRGGFRIWNFQGCQRNSMWNFQRLIKNEVEFPRVTKKK